MHYSKKNTNCKFFCLKLVIINKNDCFFKKYEIYFLSTSNACNTEYFISSSFKRGVNFFINLLSFDISIAFKTDSIAVLLMVFNSEQ